MGLKKNIQIILLLIVCLIIILFISGTLRIKCGTEYVTFEINPISDMIMNDISDEIIINKINQDTNLLFQFPKETNEHCPSCSDPLLSAVLDNREKLAQFIIQKGYPYNKTLDLLKLEKYDYLKEYKGILETLIKEKDVKD